MNPQDNPQDITSDGGRWMTKAEFAAIRRISVASADRIIRHKRWRKRAGNDGKARVLVPTEALEAPIRARPDNPKDTDGEGATDLLRSTLGIIREQIERERARADKAEESLGLSEAERERLGGELDRAIERRATAEEEARRLREAENERQQLGRWRRAWHGWRGR
jgi:hypothetical protein